MRLNMTLQKEILISLIMSYFPSKINMTWVVLIPKIDEAVK